ALVEDSEDEVDRDEGAEDEERLIRERSDEGLGRPLEGPEHGRGGRHFLLHLPDRPDRAAEGGPGGEIERDRGRGKLAEMRDEDRGRTDRGGSEGGEGDLARPGGRLDIDVAEVLGILEVLRLDLEDDVVLVELGEKGRDL